MAKHRGLVICGLLSAIVAGSLAAFGADDNAEPPVNFQGKVVMLIISRPKGLESEQSTEVLKDPVIRTIGGKAFIVGATYSHVESTDWRTGAEAGIAWDNVQQFYAYTPEKFVEALKVLPEWGIGD